MDADAFPGVAITLDGATGIGFTKIAEDAVDAADVPVAFVALTVNV
jgi:hypothetical protein